jgi:hypothetical protein
MYKKLVMHLDIEEVSLYNISTNNNLDLNLSQKY